MKNIIMLFPSTLIKGLIVPLVILIGFSVCENENDSQQVYENECRLKQDLQNNSKTHIMPPHTINSPVKIAIDLIIISLREMNEKTESLTLDAWLKMKWNDSRLSWDKTIYGGLNSIIMQYHETWKPDIKLFNSIQLSEIDVQKDVNSMVKSTGEVEWISPSTFTSSCSIDLKFFPFDVQKCILIFGSWQQNSQLEMDLLRANGVLDSSQFFNENNQWEITSNKSWKSLKYLPCCEEPVTYVSFELRLRRRSPYYKYVVLIPTLGIAVLALTMFWLPPQSNDKLILAATCFLSLIITLLHLSIKLPPAGKTVPMIVIFCGHLMLMVIVSTILSVISLVWSRSEYRRPPPKKVLKYLNSFLGKILCTTSPSFPISINHNDECNSLEMDGDDIKNVPDEKERHQYYTAQWIQCFQMFDRIAFILMAGLMSFALAGSFTFHQ